MLSLMRLIKSLQSGLDRDQRGQIVVLAVGVIIAGVGFSMIVVDFGQWESDRRDAQTDVDAVMLAAAGDLPNATTGSTTADNWADYNGVLTAPNGTLKPWDSGNSPCLEGTGATLNAGNVTFHDFNGLDENPDDGFPGYDTVCGIVERDSPALFARVFGQGDPRIRTGAAAGLFWADGACVQPWGVQTAIPGDPSQDSNADGIPDFGLEADKIYVFHSGESLTPGNFNALRLYGNGNVDYVAGIAQDCAGGGPYSGGCVDDAGRLTTDDPVPCEVKPGGMGNNTRTALEQRFQNAHPGEPLSNDRWCDVPYKEPINQPMPPAIPIPRGDYDPPAVGSDLVGKLDGGIIKDQRTMLWERVETSLANTAMTPDGRRLVQYCAYRIVLIPILADWPNGASDPTELYGIGGFYYTGYDRSGPWGSGENADQTGDDDILLTEDDNSEEDVVWGYFVRSDLACAPPKNCTWSRDPSDFAPASIFLIR